MISNASLIDHPKPQAEEEARSLQKKIQTVENDLDQTQEALMQVNAKLEEKNKSLQNVSWIILGSILGPRIVHEQINGIFSMVT